MEELVRTNDLVLLSWLTARLEAERVDAIVLDAHASVIEGSISAIQRRVMVAAGDLVRAKAVLAEAESLGAGDGHV